MTSFPFFFFFPITSVSPATRSPSHRPPRFLPMIHVGLLEPPARSTAFLVSQTRFSFLALHLGRWEILFPSSVVFEACPRRKLSRQKTGDPLLLFDQRMQTSQGCRHSPWPESVVLSAGRGLVALFRIYDDPVPSGQDVVSILTVLLMLLLTILFFSFSFPPISIRDVTSSVPTADWYQSFSTAHFLGKHVFSLPKSFLPSSWQTPIFLSPITLSSPVSFRSFNPIP